MAYKLPIIGIALVMAFIAGKMARYLKVPKVSAYIFTGLILGPSVLNLITHEFAQSFHIINEIAFGLILFNIGGEFHKGLLKKVTRLNVKYALNLCLFVFITVTALTFAFTYFDHNLDFIQRLVISCFLGIIAIAAAPPTTLLVIKELDAKGPVTQSIMVYLATGTIIAIVGAKALMFVFQEFGLVSGGIDGGPPIYALLLIWSVIGSILVGSLLGFLFSVWEQKENNEAELLFASIVVILLGFTAAYYLNLEPLLISLFMGFAVVNSSPTGKSLHVRIKGMGLSVYALFFLIAGAHIHLQEQYKTVGVVGLVYICSRIVAYFFGARLAAKISGSPSTVGNAMSFAVLSHGGAAMAITAQLQKSSNDEILATLSTIILSAVFIFELGGPLVLRTILVKMGEVKVGGLLTGTETGLAFYDLIHNFLTNTGFVKPVDHHNVKSIKLLIKRKVFAIDQSAKVKEVINFVDKHDMPIYPVVGKDNAYVGSINISQLKEVMFDPFKAPLTRAKKLIGSNVFISELASLKEAVDIFNDSGQQVLPVIDTSNHKLVGTLSYTDVVVSLKGTGFEDPTATIEVTNTGEVKEQASELKEIEITKEDKNEDN